MFKLKFIEHSIPIFQQLLLFHLNITLVMKSMVHALRIRLEPLNDHSVIVIQDKAQTLPDLVQLAVPRRQLSRSCRSPSRQRGRAEP
jgi:hypothetical protein